MSLKVRIFEHFPGLISLLIIFFFWNLNSVQIPCLIFTIPKFETLHFRINSVILRREKHVSGKFCWYVLEVAYVQLDLLLADVKRAITRLYYDTLTERQWSGWTIIFNKTIEFSIKIKFFSQCVALFTSYFAPRRDIASLFSSRRLQSLINQFRHKFGP